MGLMSDTKVVKGQYKSASNLNIRMSIHSKYSVNKTGLGNWIVSNYKFKEGARILELGCGTGHMWKNHLEILDNVSELVLSDFSEGMLESTRANLGENDKISYQQIDIQDIPFKDESFDVVIANMMLYHVPDIEKALREVSRVLKTGGTFYCATSGNHGINEFVSDVIKEFGVEKKIEISFSLQNGLEMLSKYFPKVQRLDYIDSLQITDIEDMVDYILSMASMTDVKSIERMALKNALEARMVNGILHVPKEGGMFVCEK